jgi:dihydropteroate synthase
LRLEPLDPVSPVPISPVPTALLPESLTDPFSAMLAPFDPASFSEERFVLDCRGRTLDCRPGRDGGAHVMGILNTTPDSFSDGGQFVAVEDAVSRTAEMLSEGAAIIDVGGESTRPGADPVTAEEEQDRVVPVIEAISAEFPDTLISIDTYKPTVAAAALDAGAHIVNDVTGLREHPETASVAADYGAPMVVMHSVNEPGALTEAQDYDDVTEDVESSIRSSLDIAVDAGVPDLITDPGFGFGKTVEDNLRLVNTVDRLLDLNRPVLVGISRKSTIGRLLGSNDAPRPVDQRLFGSLGATAPAVMRGATIVRTHDVAPTVDFLKVLGATMQHR